MKVVSKNMVGRRSHALSDLESDIIEKRKRFVHRLRVYHCQMIGKPLHLNLKQLFNEWKKVYNWGNAKRKNNYGEDFQG